VLQSCPARQPLAKPARHLRALMVGHLRDEKDPETYLRAARRLAGRARHPARPHRRPLDPALGAAATRWPRPSPSYRWLGGLPHAATRRRIQQAHVLVHPSRMEGGAHVVIEALRSGTPVLASRIDGNLGLLGDDYARPVDPGATTPRWPPCCSARDDPGYARRPAPPVPCARRCLHPTTSSPAARPDAPGLLAAAPSSGEPR
jgi:glycosyltransferase involved in cell wall biosynthesis